MEEIERVAVPIDSVMPHPENYKKHPDNQLNSLKASLLRFGQIKSVVVQRTAGGDNAFILLAGHGLTMAAQELLADPRYATNKRVQSWRGSWAVVVVPSSWSPLEAKAYMVADNAIAEKALTDEVQLAALLEEQRAADMDLSSVGSSEEELNTLLEKLAQEFAGQLEKPTDEEDEFDTTPEEGPTRSHTGELWQLGEHRLLVGDSTKRENVARLMQGKRAVMCFTSPPYNVGGNNSELSGNTHVTKSKYVIGGEDAFTSQDYFSLIYGFTDVFLPYCEYMFVNIQMLSGNKLAFLDYLHQYRSHLADIAIWDKGNAQPAMARKVMNSQFEFILMLSSKSNPTRAIGTLDFRGTVSNVYQGDPQHNNEFSEVHAATFPLHLPSWAIENFTQDGEIIVDPFGGTGTTLIACERLARACHMMELEPRYADVILRRWEAETGQTALLLESAGA